MRKVLKIPARFMRGGTSKGVFFCRDDLPPPGIRRDRILLRTMGSPDPYGKQMDGMGGATSSTSKIIIAGSTKREDHDLEYLFAQAAVKERFMDYSGNCGNLTAAVGSFAINSGIIKAEPQNGICKVRMWQQNIGKTIIAHIPVVNGEAQEMGDFELDGVTFPAAEVKLEFLEPSDTAVFPTGNTIDTLDIPGFGSLDATLINAAIPMVFLRASDLGLKGTEMQSEVDDNVDFLQTIESIRAQGAYRMGLVKSVEEAKLRQHSPKLAFISPPQDYTASSGKQVKAADSQLCVRAISMGKMHHAFMGTGAVALAAAASTPGTLVHELRTGEGALTFGHPSGVLEVEVKMEKYGDDWVVENAIMSRSARTLMEGYVHVPV